MLSAMEPSAAIAIIETDLRAVVRSLYPSGWTAKVSAEELEQLSKRRDEEARRRAPVSVPTDLLAYTHFYELRKILESDWGSVAPVLGKKREFEVWADHVEDFRNAPAHSRELLWHERALLEGIAGLIRVRVTKYRSSQGRDAMFYPVIEHVVDSFGSAVDAPNPDELPPTVDSQATLVPGQTVQFRMRGTDPQGRELIWELRSDVMTVRDSARGSEAELTWEVLDEDVRARCFVEIRLKSSGVYHRRSSHDQAVNFEYRVDPPPEST
jgi:hypothetical protein